MSVPEEKEKEDDFQKEYEELERSSFKQQRLPAWRPVPTITCTFIIFLAFGLIFVVIGIVILVYSGDIVEVSQIYGNDVPIGKNGRINLTIPSKMSPPIMVYYQLNGFYQNHRRYVRSKSDSQLHGETFSLKEMRDNGDCDPAVTNADMGRTKNFMGEDLDPDDLTVPCGLVAKSFFDDRFFGWNVGGKNIEVSEKDIAWDADKDIKYKNTNNLHKQWIDMTDEHFMVWMRPAGLPNFRKLWGRIEDSRYTLNSGDILSISYENNFDVSRYKGEKYIVLSTVNAFGGKNKFLGISYIVVGGVCIVLAIVFMVGYKLHQNKIK